MYSLHLSNATTNLEVRNTEEPIGPDCFLASLVAAAEEGDSSHEDTSDVLKLVMHCSHEGSDAAKTISVRLLQLVLSSLYCRWQERLEADRIKAIREWVGGSPEAELRYPHSSHQFFLKLTAAAHEGWANYPRNLSKTHLSKGARTYEVLRDTLCTSSELIALDALEEERGRPVVVNLARLFYMKGFQSNGDEASKMPVYEILARLGIEAGVNYVRVMENFYQITGVEK